MRQVRNCVFETNSSSTHSIAIPRSGCAPSYVSFHDGEFGWSFDEVDAADYFYTAIYDVSETLAEAEERIAKLTDILNDYNIEFDFSEVNCEDYDGWLSHDGYIDHGGELKDFVDELLDHGDKLVRFLGSGLVFTGNDNSDCDGFVDRTTEFIENYDWSSRTWVKHENPYYMSNHDEYEWYYKGN